MDTSKISEEQVNKLFKFQGIYPQVDPSVFLAEGVKIIGDVTIGKGSNIWYNSVLRGDVHYIRIGEYTNIQDCSMIHVTGEKYPVNIGNMVTIGHSVKLHGCTVKDLCLIGIGAIVLDGAIVEEKSMVAAGSVVRPNMIVPTGKLVAGVPAKVVRDLTQEELDYFEKSAMHYDELARISRESLKI